MNRKLIGVTGLLLSIPFHAHADAVSQLEAEYQAQGGTIEPKAPTADPKYLTELKQINKWFVRNCRRTLGRECATQEKGNYLAYYKNL